MRRGRRMGTEEEMEEREHQRGILGVKCELEVGKQFLSTFGKLFVLLIT